MRDCEDGRLGSGLSIAIPLAPTHLSLARPTVYGHREEPLADIPVQSSLYGAEALSNTYRIVVALVLFRPCDV